MGLSVVDQPTFSRVLRFVFFFWCSFVLLLVFFCPALSTRSAVDTPSVGRDDTSVWPQNVRARLKLPSASLCWLMSTSDEPPCSSCMK